MEEILYDFTFRYKDALSKWEWKEQHCRCTSEEQMIKFYGLDKDDVEWELLDKKKVIHYGRNIKTGEMYELDKSNPA